MSDELAGKHETVRQIVASAPKTEDGMLQLIDYCKRQLPNRIWDRFNRLDYEKDVKRLGGWFRSLLISEPPPGNINAFWFGLFTACKEDGKETFSLYVIGSTSYDSSDDSGDWACITNESFVPKGRYAKSKILSEIYELVSKDEAVKEIGEYVLCLGYAGLAIKEITRGIEPRLLFGLRDSRAIAVGFDEGDFITLNPIAC
jgi:hypothetical protein